MRRGAVAVVVLAFLACATLPLRPSLVLYAQSLPSVKHAIWTPPVIDATHSAPTQYAITVDGGNPIILPASSCTATCSQVIGLSTFGAHTVIVVAQNLSLSTDPTLQSGPPATITFSLNQAPGLPTGGTVTN